MNLLETCPTCGEHQWSVADRRYAYLFGTCWAEDRARWDRGELTLEEFEDRELQAAKSN